MKTPPAGFGWWLCGAALALRAGWVVYRWTTHGSGFDYPDEDLHWQLATHLVRDGILATDDGRLAARMPLYPLLLAPCAALGSTGVLVARLMQTLFGAASVGVAYRLADAAFGRRAALAAGVLACCDPFGIFFANLLLTEVPFTLLALGLVACAWRFVAGPGAGRGALIGLAVTGAAAALTRPSAVLWLPACWLLVAWLHPRRRSAAPRLLLCPVVLGLALVPWGLRNRAVLGEYAWLSANGGVTLYDAQGPQADGSSNQAFLQALPELATLGEVARDRALARLAIAQMRADPARVLQLASTKFLRTWSLIPNVTEYRTGAAAFVGAAYTALLLLGAAAGLVRTARGTQANACQLQALLWLPIVYFTLLHSVYVGSVRYRVPLMPLLAVAAASTLCSSDKRAFAASQPKS